MTNHAEAQPVSKQANRNDRAVSDAELVRQAYQAVHEGRQEVLREFFAEQFVLILPPTHPLAGEYHGLREAGECLQDAGSFISKVKSGAIQPVANVAAFRTREVELVDGSVVPADVVISATGYRRGLFSLLRDKSLLREDGSPVAADGHEAAPGLYFVGFTLSLGGALRDISKSARTLARHEGLAPRKWWSVALTLLPRPRQYAVTAAERVRRS